MFVCLPKAQKNTLTGRYTHARYLSLNSRAPSAHREPSHAPGQRPSRRVSLAAQPAAPSSHLAAQAQAGPAQLTPRALGAAIHQLPVLVRAAQDADLGQVAEKELVGVGVQVPAVHLRSARW